MPRLDASLSCSFAPQGLFPPTGCISAFLFCYTGIIPTGRMHLYLAFLFHRDDFHRPNASLSCSFVTQGLFPPPGCISIFLFCFTEIISAGRIHPYPALFHHRDYFHRPDSSLPSSFAPQGLFPPPRFIPAFLFCSTGIISANRMHLYLALLFHRDYFGRPNASLSCSFVTQGLFCPGRIHLYLALLLHRDYFRRPDASLSFSFAPQGLFRPAECISSLLFSSTWIISAGRMHPQLALLFHRDYFHRPDSSLSSSFAPQGLFPPAGCISILLFCYAGIISTGQMHLYLALLFHRDYFGQPNASLIRAPVKYQRPNFYYTGNTRMASADTLCKKLLPDRQK